MEGLLRHEHACLVRVRQNAEEGVRKNAAEVAALQRMHAECRATVNHPPQVVPHLVLSVPTPPAEVPQPMPIVPATRTYTQQALEQALRDVVQPLTWTMEDINIPINNINERSNILVWISAV